MGECLLHQVCGETNWHEDVFKILEFGLSGFKVTDVVGPVTHTSKHSSDGSFMVVCVAGDVAVSMGGFAVDAGA